jgi:sugar O-acyltransferase (sialic acid O-acetyltransferase NeuD family)
MLKVAVIGAGGHGKVVADAVLAAGIGEVIGFLDDDQTLWGTRILGFSVLGPIATWSARSVDALAMGIGSNRDRKRAFEALTAASANIATVVHPRATLGTGVCLGRGVVALSNVVVNADTTVGDNVILNTACTVEHDNIISAHAHLAPGVVTAAEVRVGEGAFLALGAKILPRISIGEWSVVGAGAVVTERVPNRVTVAGCPAREVRRHDG